MTQPQNPWGNSQSPQQQPGQPYPQQPPKYPEVKPLPTAWQQPIQPQQWNPSGVYGGAPEPKKDDFPWGVVVLIAIVVLVVTGVIVTATKETNSTTTQPTGQAALATTAPIQSQNTTAPTVQRRATIAPTVATAVAASPTPIVAAAAPASKNPLVLTRKGNKPSEKINLPKGLMKVNVTYDGTGFFSASIFNIDNARWTIVDTVSRVKRQFR